MYRTINELMIGNEKMADYYGQAKVIWESLDILNENLSKIICDKQSEFERICQDRALGQEIMVYSGVMQYINDNDNEDDRKLASKVCNAIISSNCSNAAKSYAGDLAKVYTF